MTGEFRFPPAPAIGGDAYEIDRWFQQISEHLDKFTGQEREDIELDLLHQIRREFWEANPETTPERVEQAREKRIRTDEERKLQRRVEAERMKDPGYIFEEGEE